SAPGIMNSSVTRDIRAGSFVAHPPSSTAARPTAEPEIAFMFSPSEILRLDSLERPDAPHPAHRGPAPDLPLRNELCALAHGADTDAVLLRVRRVRRIDRCSAVRAKRLRTL